MATVVSGSIDTALVAQYHSNIELQYQQKGSRLRNWVDTEIQNAEFDYYDRIGSTAATEIVTRHADTPLIESQFDRRRVQLRDFDWADLIDRRDKIRMLADPTSAYTMNASYALGRSMDDVIIAAYNGTAYSGKTGSTSTTFPSSSQVAVNYVESGSTANSNLTIGKLRNVRQLLLANEAVADDEPLVAVVTQSQITSLLRTTEVTNADYNGVKALVSGQVDTFMGFKFIRTQRLISASSIRKCYFHPKSAIKLGIGADITVKVEERSDKRYSVQVYVSASFGATRMWEDQVIEVACDETT